MLVLPAGGVTVITNEEPFPNTKLAVISLNCPIGNDKVATNEPPVTVEPSTPYSISASKVLEEPKF